MAILATGPADPFNGRQNSQVHVHKTDKSTELNVDEVVGRRMARADSIIEEGCKPSAETSNIHVMESSFEYVLLQHDGYGKPIHG